MEPNDKKDMPHREFESTFALLTPEQRKAELSVYEIIFGATPKTPKPGAAAVAPTPRKRRVSTRRYRSSERVNLIEGDK